MLKLLVAAFLTLAAACAGAVTAGLEPSLLADGSQVDTDALGKRTPLVLVHGLGGGPTGWDAFLHAYVANASWRAAFKPYSYSYASSASDVLSTPGAPRTLPGLGAQMRDFLQKSYDKPTTAPDFGIGNKSIVILSHSMGGLVARSMMQETMLSDGSRAGYRVIHLITAGAPHQGSPMADAGFAVGLPAVPEFMLAYAGFVAGMTWTNFDGLNPGIGLCNAWLARLNTYQPMPATTYGNCGTVQPVALPGFYERIVAYGSRSLQDKDLDIGLPGIYKPGSSSNYYLPYAYMYSGLPNTLQNDGVVPFTSEQFAGNPVFARAEAFQCDHAYMQHGYPETVRTFFGSYSDWAFCQAQGGTNVPSGRPDGYAVSASIFGAPGGIVDIIKTVNQAERVFDWAESAYGAYLQPAGQRTGIIEGYYERYYAGTGAYIGVKNGNVFYMGPASGGQLQTMGTLAEFFGKAQAAGY